MQFTYPNFLWTLLLIAVPILIHFLNLRRHQTVYFSNVSFLKQVQRQTQKRSQLKQLLILLSRILAIVALVFAFAKPYFPRENDTQLANGGIKCIYIDNSFSMNAESNNGVALEFAKNKAYQIIESSKPTTKFALLTNDFDQRYYRFYSAAEATKLVGEAQASFKQVPISKVVNRFKTMLASLQQANANAIYFISDFQKCTTDFDKLEADTASIYNLVPIEIINQSNLYLDTCWFNSPTHHLNQDEELMVRIVNGAGDDVHQLSVKLFINDSLKSMATVNIPEGESTEVALNYKNNTTGFKNGKIEISDYPIIYDNQLYFNYHVRNQLKALQVVNNTSKKSNALDALFRNDDYISLDRRSQRQLQLSKLKNYNVIFLNELETVSLGLKNALKDYLNNGGTLVITPNVNLSTSGSFASDLGGIHYIIRDTSSIPIATIDLTDRLYANVFKDMGMKVELPIIKNRLKMYDPLGASEVILTFADKSPALTRSQAGNGHIYNFAFNTNSTAFTQDVLFVPTFYNLVLYAANTQDIYQNIGQQTIVNLPNEQDLPTDDVSIMHQQTKTEWKPEVLRNSGNVISLFINQDLQAGFYDILNLGIKVGAFALNFNHSESDMHFYTPSEIETKLQTVGIEQYNFVETEPNQFESAIAALEHGKQLWKLFIYFALFFLVTELIISRFMK